MESEHNSLLTETKYKTEEHEKETLSLKEKVSAFTNNNSFMENLIFWGVISFGVYFFGSSIVAYVLNSKGKNAIDYAESMRRKLNNTNNVIHSFMAVNNDGNSTLEPLLSAHGINPTEHHESAFKKKKSKTNV